MREQLLYRVNQQLLIWGEEEYEALSGPYGKGSLPPGFYTIQVRRVTDSQLLRESFRHADSGVAFFIPITPRFETDRSGFGIHPDGYHPQHFNISSSPSSAFIFLFLTYRKRDQVQLLIFST